MLRLEKRHTDLLHFDDLFVKIFVFKDEGISISFDQYYYNEQFIEKPCKLNIKDSGKSKIKLIVNNIELDFREGFGIIDMIWKINIIDNGINIKGNYLNGASYDLTIIPAECWFDQYLE